MDNTEIVKGFKKMTFGPLDGWYGPYESIEAACLAIPNIGEEIEGKIVNFRQSKVVGIITPDGVINHSWDKFDYTNEALEPVFVDLTEQTAVINSKVQVIQDVLLPGKADKSNTYTKSQIDAAIVGLSPESEVLVPIFESKESINNKNQPDGYAGLNDRGFVSPSILTPAQIAQAFSFETVSDYMKSGKFYSNVLNKYTGRGLNVTEATNKFDGSPITDADVNNVDVFKFDDGKYGLLFLTSGAVDVRDFGAKGEAVTYQTGASVAGSDIFTITDADLTDRLIGNLFSIRDAGADSKILYGSVLEVLSTTTFRASLAAVNTVSGSHIIIGGVDSTNAFQRGIDYISQKSNGGKLIIPGLSFWVNGTVTIQPRKRGTPVEIEGISIMSMQDGWGIDSQGSCLLRTSEGDMFKVNLNNANEGKFIAPYTFTGFAFRNTNFISWSNKSITALNVFRTRGIYENLSCHRIDYLIRQDNTDSLGNLTYCDNSVFNNLKVAYSQLGGIKLSKIDGSRICGFIFEAPDAGAKYGIEVFNSPAFSIENFIHGAPANSVTTPGSALIKLTQCFAVRVSAIHVEDNRLEAIFRLDNCGALSFSNLFTYLNNQTCFKIVGLIKGLHISDWYSYEDRPAGTYDIDFGPNTTNTDINWRNIELFDNTQVAGALRRKMVFNNYANRGKNYYEVPVEYTTDIQTLYGNCQFRSLPGCSNLPDGITYLTGHQHLLNDDPNYACQVGMSGNYLYTIYKNNGVWGTWNKILNSLDLATINTNIAAKLGTKLTSDLTTVVGNGIVQSSSNPIGAPYSGGTYFTGPTWAHANNPAYQVKLLSDTLGNLFVQALNNSIALPDYVLTKWEVSPVTTTGNVLAGNTSTLFSVATAATIVQNIFVDNKTLPGVQKIFRNDGTGLLQISFTAGTTLDGTLGGVVVNLPSNSDELWIISTAANTWKTVNKKLKISASADTAVAASGTTPTKVEFDALLGELRDLKSKMRTANILV